MKINRAELLKTALIVLLAASAIFLGWRTKLFSELFKSVPFFGSVADLVKSASGDETGAYAKEAARPLGIVITGKDGQRYGVKYDAEARNAVYDRTSSIVGEALGTAAAISGISEDEWREALSDSGVYYEYLIPVRLSVLDIWLDAKMTQQTGDAALRRIFVTFGDQKNRLYYQDSESGHFYGADTASSADIERDLDIYSSNGTQFAYETGVKAADAAPYLMIIPESAKKIVSAAAAGTAEELLEITLSAFGHSNETYTTSLIGSGSAVTFIGAQFNVVIRPDGSVTYRNTVNPREAAGGQAAGDSGMIEQARRIAAEMLSGAPGGAEVFFESIERRAGNYCTVAFNYYIAGGRIYLPEEASAAKFTFNDGVIIEAEMFFRTYTTAGEYTGLLPEIQALAAAGREYHLCYSDNGRETLRPFWLPVESIL